MRRKHDLFRILPVLAFIVASLHAPLCGQALKSNSRTNFMRTAKTSDVLYTNDSTYFLMDRSPLEQFPDYKKLYDGKVDPYGDVYVLYGRLIRPDTMSNYMVDWCLNGDMLYMSDILPNVLRDKTEETFPDNEQYKLMEKLTGVKFDKKCGKQTSYTYKGYQYAPPAMHNLHNPPGAMPATWFSDTIVVKRAVQYKDELEKWFFKEPCRELVFEKGRLISDRIKEGMW